MTQYNSNQFSALSVNKVLSQTFMMVGVMWLITAGVSMFTMHWVLSTGLLFGSLIASFALIFFISANQSSGLGILGLLLFAAVEGLTFGPLLNHYLHMRNGSDIVTMSATGTAVSLIVCSLVAQRSGKKFLGIGTFLFGATIALILTSLIGMFFHIQGLSLVISLCAVVIFIGWLLFDLSRIMQDQEVNYVSASLSIYLDTLNLMTHLMNLFSSRDD